MKEKVILSVLLVVAVVSLTIFVGYKDRESKKELIDAQQKRIDGLLESIEECNTLSDERKLRIYNLIESLKECDKNKKLLPEMEEAKSCMKSCGKIGDNMGFNFIRVDSEGFVICSKEKK